MNVVAGDVLSADTVVHTGIGASLVLRDGERTFSVPAGQNGRRLADVVASGSGLRISGNVSHIETGAAAADDDIAAE